MVSLELANCLLVIEGEHHDTPHTSSKRISFLLPGICTSLGTFFKNDGRQVKMPSELSLGLKSADLGFLDTVLAPAAGRFPRSVPLAKPDLEPKRSKSGPYVWLAARLEASFLRAVRFAR